jgi:DTW domain-containing protein YfiP
MLHAVARLRAERVARSRKPFVARGSGSARCAGCRVPAAFCLCALRPSVPTRAGMCLLMHDAEPMKPTNTGWLVADVVADTEAFGWARTHADPRLLALLSDPRWTPYVVFPADGAAEGRVVRDAETTAGRRPLFVLLDGTWAAASRMFRASPYLDSLPVLSFAPEQVSRYRLRRASREGQLCTAEVAALCLRLAGEDEAARALDGWLDAFVARTEDARRGGTPRASC